MTIPFLSNDASTPISTTLAVTRDGSSARQGQQQHHYHRLEMHLKVTCLEVQNFFILLYSYILTNLLRETGMITTEHNGTAAQLFPHTENFIPHTQNRRAARPGESSSITFLSATWKVTWQVLFLRSQRGFWGSWVRISLKLDFVAIKEALLAASIDLLATANRTPDCPPPVS